MLFGGNGDARHRRLLGSVAAGGLLAAAPVGAADLAVAPAPVIAPVPSLNWTGWYIGGNVGGKSGRFAGQALATPAQPFTTPIGNTLQTFTTTAGDFLNITDVGSSAVGGGQLGFNWQFGRWVFGVEGDLDAADVERTIPGPGSSIFVLGDTFRFKNDWQASVRARGGVAFDRWLAYATGGVAWAGVSAQAVYAPNTFRENTSTNLGPVSVPGGASVTVPGSFGSDRRTLIGGTVGGGLEYAITNSLSLGVEYRYSDFGSKAFNLGAVPFPVTPSTVTARLSVRTNEVTARLNYRFGGMAGSDAAGADAVANWWGSGLDTTPAPAPREAARVYGGADYLLWMVKDAPLSAPLVTTGEPFGPTRHGYLVSSDTTILYGAPRAPGVGGDDSQSFSAFNGARLTLGYWLDEAQRYAVESRGFLLQTRSAGFAIHGDANGSPVIAIPLYNTVAFTTPGGFTEGLGENAVPLSLLNTHTGGVTITNSLRLWGVDATGVMNLYRTPSWEFSALGGFRYLDLSEKFNLAADITGLTIPFAGQSGSAFDVFQTRNRFYGASLGLRGSYLYGPFTLEMSGRVSLGVSHEVLNVYGGYQSYNFQGPGTTQSGPEGFFAQPENSGRYSTNDFAFVPEAQVKLGYDVTPAIRLSVGYDVLYESSVVRPGDQINRNLPKGQTFQQGGSAVSATSPTPLFNRTDFYAHGLTAGVSFRF